MFVANDKVKVFVEEVGMIFLLGMQQTSLQLLVRTSISIPTSIFSLLEFQWEVVHIKEHTIIELFFLGLLSLARKPERIIDFYRYLSSNRIVICLEASFGFVYLKLDI